MSCGNLCLREALKEVEKIANQDCSCTEDQQEGLDPTVCRSCEAAHILNEVGEDLRQGLGRVKGLK